MPMMSRSKKMGSRRRLLAIATAALLPIAALHGVGAQERDAGLPVLDLSQVDLSGIDLSQLDVSSLLANAAELVRRAPDAELDGLFQATHHATRSASDARVLCAVFVPAAAASSDNRIDALVAAGSQLSDGSRQAIGVALADIAGSGMQNEPQPYDAIAARQVLKSAGVTAMLLHDGFSAGLASTGDDQAGRDARCRSFGWMLDAVHDLPMKQRAAVTRLMLHEGLAFAATMPAQGLPPSAAPVPLQ